MKNSSIQPEKCFYISAVVNLNCDCLSVCVAAHSDIAGSNLHHILKRSCQLKNHKEFSYLVFMEACNWKHLCFPSQYLSILPEKMTSFLFKFMLKLGESTSTHNQNTNAWVVHDCGVRASLLFFNSTKNSLAKQLLLINN